MDCSLSGSSIHGIFQARILEWVAISFSNAWKWKVKVKSLSRVRPSATPWTAAYQAPPSIGFSKQEYWSGLPLPSPVHKLKLMQIEGKSAFPDLKTDQWLNMLVAFIGNYSTLKKEHEEIWCISWWLSLRWNVWQYSWKSWNVNTAQNFTQAW